MSKACILTQSHTSRLVNQLSKLVCCQSYFSTILQVFTLYTRVTFAQVQSNVQTSSKCYIIIAGNRRRKFIILLYARLVIGRGR